MPERSQPYNPETEPGNIERRRAAAAMHLAGRAMETTVITVPTEHLSYHEKLQAALQAEGALSAARFSDWQSLTKDSDGEAQIHDLHGSRFEVKFEHEPLWTPIAPVELKRALLRRPERGRQPGEMFTTIVVPDLQIPFIDEKAVEIFYQVLSSLKVDNVVQLGDALDLTAYSRFLDSEMYKDATQEALFMGLEFFRNVRKLAPSARITYLEGNHEQRLPKNILTNHRANWRLRAADQPDGDPLISVPNMLGLKSVDVEYLPGYPNNRYWVNDALQIIHGSTTGRGENKRVNFQEKISSVFGHTHRLGTHRETINSRQGGDYRSTYNAGTLSRIDTHVPSTKTGYDLDGQPVGGHNENWQHGFLVITHDDKGYSNVEEVSINTFNGYRTMFRGKVYEPREVTDGAV